MTNIQKSRLFLIIAIIFLLLLIGNNTNWFGLKKPATRPASPTARLANDYSGLTPEQSAELDAFKAELEKA